jgi:hypothetical protein
VRLFGVFALVQVGFKFPFGERRIGEFGEKLVMRPIGALLPYASNSRTHMGQSHGDVCCATYDSRLARALEQGDGGCRQQFLFD